MTIAPQVLVIKLMRVEGDRVSATGKKNRTQVDFSARLGIDATVMCEVWEPNRFTYKLAAVSSHTGNESLSEGHYRCFVLEGDH